jgi:integrase
MTDANDAGERNRGRGNGEGTVYFDSSKQRWFAKVSVDGKRRKRAAPTEAAAKRLLREMLSTAADGATPSHGNMTVADLLDEWSTNALPARNLRPGTIEVNLWAVKALTDMIGSKRLRGLDPADVERVFRKATYSRESFIKIRSVLGKALDYGVRRKLITTNIARHVEIPANAPRTEDGRALTVEQAKILLAHARSHRLYPLWLLMVSLGLRPGEATGLCWSDVDLKKGVIHVRRSLKLEKKHLVLDEHLKTKRARRSLAAPSIVIDALREHRAEQSASRAAAGFGPARPTDLVFSTTEFTPINPSNLRRDFSRLTTAVGLGHWHPHELRHSAASIMSAAGVPLEQIADTLGHDGTRMTALVYRHAVTPTITAATIMSDILG